MWYSAETLCRASLRFLIDLGLLGDYEESGPYTPPCYWPAPAGSESRLLAHYAPCAGALYRDIRQWEFAYSLVERMTAHGRRRAGPITLSGIFGQLPVRPDQLIDTLEFACGRLGLRPHGISKTHQMATFGTSGTSMVRDLPEPYGKWLQHRLGRPRWNDRLNLEVQMTCRLESPRTRMTTMDVSLSAPALVLLGDLDAELSEALAVPAHLGVPALVDLGRQCVRGRTAMRLLPAG